MSRRIWVVTAAVLVVVVGIVVVLAATSSHPADTSTGAPALPAAASTTGSAGSEVVVSMGHLDDPANTFAELFTRAADSQAWVLSTPPGVADNGGLVAGASPTGTVTAGFLPSADLTFSVLAQRAPGGTTWSPGDVPGAVAPQPDALATGADGGVAAVLVRPTASVVASGPDLATWHRVATPRDLAPASARCAVTGITAVAFGSTGAPVLGAACAGPTIGIFATAPSGGWVLLGRAPVTGGVRATRVLRLDAGTAGIVGLVEGTGTTTSVVPVWGAAGGLVSGAPLAVPAGWSVLATAVGGGSGRAVTVLLGSDSGSARRISVFDGPPAGAATDTWTDLPAAPAGVAAVATVGTETDAFGVDGSHLTVWSTVPAGTRWTVVAHQTVPIQYGSSS